MTIDVFLSVGRTSTSEQDAFIVALENLLSGQRLNPRTVGRTDFAGQKPLRNILDVMQQCSGTIVVAFERFHFAQGIEFPGGPNAAPLRNINLPTVWNQVEAAMGYTLGQPLLAIVDSTLLGQGLLEEGYDWFVKWLAPTPESLGDPAFLETFMAWKQRVTLYKSSKEKDRSSS